jgi:hypothetical protein
LVAGASFPFIKLLRAIDGGVRRTRQRTSTIIHCALAGSEVGSGTGRDPGGIFRDPDLEIPDFGTSRDFSGFGIFRELAQKIPPDLFSKFPGFFGINFSDYMIIDDKNLLYFHFYLAILANN